MARKAHNRIDLQGRQFGRVIVVQEVGVNRHGKVTWLCRCFCGKEFVTVGAYLRTGDVQTCGCSRKDNPGFLKHGHTGRSGVRKFSAEYAAWNHMKQRCDNPNDIGYANYGGRGITYDERWKEFTAFLADMGLRPAKGFSLDRRDNSKGYSKGNCRWVDRLTQNRNKRSNIPITFQGETKLLCEWAEQLNISYFTLHYRLFKAGWTVEKAFAMPMSKKKP